MRIVSNRCHLFEYEVTGAGPCAVGLDPATVGVRKLFVDCLVLQVEIEPGDAAVIAAAVEIIKRMAAHSDAGCIVIDGLAPRTGSRYRGLGADHDILTGLADALDLLSELAERLEEHGEPVHPMPFGWNTIRYSEFGGNRPRRVTRLRPAPPLTARHRSPRLAGTCRPQAS